MFVLMVPALFLWALIGNIVITNALVLILALVFGFATNEKMRQRAEPLYPDDIRMITEIDFLMDMLPPWLFVLFVVGVAIAIGLFIWLCRVELKKKRMMFDKKLRIFMLALTSLGMLYISNFQEDGNVVKKLYDRTAYWIPYSQQMNYYNNGFVAGFLYNFTSSPMWRPDGINQTKMAELIEKYEEKAAEINQERKNEQIEANIIYIMNESFADPHQLQESRKVWDPIPFTRELGEDQWAGKMLSPGYGGGTANIEFEALTGFSMEPFAPNVSTPYTQFLPKSDGLPSVVSRMNAEGHHTTAIHPYDTSMYKRIDNYEVLGFDEFYYDETMRFTEKIENNPYISDESAYNEVLYRMKETDGYDFIHLVTMQNHTPFSGKYEDIPSYIQTGFRSEQVNQYIQDLVYSDIALRQLHEAVLELEEPTVVVLWGDHWPSVFGEASFQKNGFDVFHQTPVVIFSNMHTEPKDLQVMSPIYFFNEVLTMLDVKVSPFDAFLLALQEEVPALERGIYFDKETGTFVEKREELSVEAQKILAEYDWILYDTTTGNKMSVKNHFFNTLKESE